MRRAVLTLSALLLSVTAATADPLSIGNILGGWQNEVAPGSATITNAPGQGTDTVTWGTPPTPSDPQSGYDFTPVSGTFFPLLNTPFLLGTFVHHNNVITPTGLTAIQYSFSADTNGTPSTLNDVFQFFHDETPNVSGTCVAPGPQVGPPCDDIVTVQSLFGINALINVGDDNYFFNLLGFSTDGGNTFSNVFQSAEGGQNAAELYAIVTSTPLPEPASMALFGTGLAILGVKLRRRKNDATV